MKHPKSNAMRLLDAAGISYQPLYYELSEADFSGEAVSGALGLSPDCCFKTLCAKTAENQLVLFVIPVNATLSMKKACVVGGTKKIELVPVRELKKETGYERGSVTPIGLKKPCAVYISELARPLPKMEIGSGSKGCSLLLKPQELANQCHAAFADLTEPSP